MIDEGNSKKTTLIKFKNRLRNRYKNRMLIITGKVSRSLLYTLFSLIVDYSNIEI